VLYTHRRHDCFTCFFTWLLYAHTLMSEDAACWYESFLMPSMSGLKTDLCVKNVCCKSSVSWCSWCRRLKCLIKIIFKMQCKVIIRRHISVSYPELACLTAGVFHAWMNKVNWFKL
jgi:hypothetical protein